MIYLGGLVPSSFSCFWDRGRHGCKSLSCKLTFSGGPLRLFPNSMVVSIRWDPNGTSWEALEAGEVSESVEFSFMSNILRKYSTVPVLMTRRQGDKVSWIRAYYRICGGSTSLWLLQYSSSISIFACGYHALSDLALWYEPKIVWVEGQTNHCSKA